MPLLEVEGLTKHFSVSKSNFQLRKQKITAVDDIDLSIDRSETLGLVGESGCGKTTVARLLLRLIKPTSGIVKFDGENIFDYKRNQLKKLRSDLQIIFQDPFSSLNPRMKVGEIIAEPLVIHRSGTKSDRRKRVSELMEIVGLSKGHVSRFPHEFSGGQQQRIGIARALALRPSLVVCDEPVSALDVSIQAQVLELLKDIQKEFGIAYLFISHDLGVIRHMCSRVAVMYLGRIVEEAGYEDIYSTPIHPYTEALLSAVSVPDPKSKKNINRIILKGDRPSPLESFKGCSFHNRCPIASDICAIERPLLTDISSGHLVACHFAQDRSKKIIKKLSTPPIDFV